MKKLIILVLIIFAKSAFAQKDTVGLNVPFVNNTVIYERVFDVPNAPKNLLYSNAGLWFAETHPYVGKTDLQLQDPALSRVAGRIISSVDTSSNAYWNSFHYTYTFNCTIQIDCKDNKYRIRIYNFEDVLDGPVYTPLDNLMQSLINSKSCTLANGGVLKTPDLKIRFQKLNAVINNVMADINKSILADNSF